ncbi:MAG TPA: hypothetical protein VFZ61_15130 [Polyangiales bacterium]
MQHPVHPWIDIAHAPVYHLSYPAYDPNDARQLAQYTTAQSALYATLAAWTTARRRAYGFTVDLSQIGASTAMNRQRAIQYMERVRERGSPFMACRAFVTPSEEVRGIMTAVFWGSPPSYPHAFFTSVSEARNWARDQTLALDLQLTRTANR